MASFVNGNGPINFLSFETVDAPDFNKFGDGIPCILGIDEAGRGPLLGPMVYGCAVILDDKEEELVALGAKDSKTLNETRREEIFAKIRESKFATYSLRVVHPRVISLKMNRRIGESLNDISHNCAIQLIRGALDQGICIKKVFVDLVGKKEEDYQLLLRSHFPNIEIIVSKKADSIFPIVGAASICAKVMRDKRMREWEFEEDGFGKLAKEMGCGYPNDPLTKKFIAKNVDPVFGFPSVARFSFKPIQDVIQKRGVKIDWNFGKENKSKQPTLMELWAAKPKEEDAEKKTISKKMAAHISRHIFFTRCGLSNIQQL